MRLTRSPLSIAILALIGTGLLADAVIYLSFFVLGKQFPGSWMIAAGILLAGLLGCLTLLSRAWRPLARKAGDGTIVATIVTGVLLVLLMGSAVQFTGLVAGRVCPWETAESCSIDAMITVVTAGAIVPWILAGIPALLTLGLRARFNRSGLSAGGQASSGGGIR
jgi:hypothetical protein